MTEENIIMLIVDDDEDDKQLFIESAKEVNENILCITARDGQEALEYLNNPENKLPDYIFLDLRMPRFNGEKTLNEIKKQSRLQHIPVIIYTTSREVEKSIALKKLGAAHFVSKPVNPEEIYYLICSVIEQKWI